MGPQWGRQPTFEGMVLSNSSSRLSTYTGAAAVADQPKRPEGPESEEPKTEETTPGKSKFASFFGKTAQYWVAFLLVSTLVIHGIGWAYYKSVHPTAPPDISPEIGVGDFRFAADKTAGSRISAAEFSLYITALDGLDKIARCRLASHKFRVQGEIESLLRKAHGGDFADPALNDLKRQMRERIDETLGNRVVSDVIVTNLRFTMSDNKEPSAAAADTKSSPPWLDKSSAYVSQQGGN
jgi:flagellar basal body-associated protein FliL